MKIHILFITLTMSLIAVSAQADAPLDCTMCHGTLLEKYGRHEGAVFGCGNCHELPTEYPHKLKLKAPLNDLCFQCHEKKRVIGNHVSVGNPPQSEPTVGHPVFRDKDPLYPERQFTCASCHNPHSSDMPHLFRYNYNKDTPYKGQLCAVCHWDLPHPNEPKPPTPPWNTD